MISAVAAVYDRRTPSKIACLFPAVIDRRYSNLLLIGTAFALNACTSAVTPEKISQIKPAMKTDQVEAILGRPARIDQAETTTLRGETYHYPAPNGEGRVIFLNDTVFKAEFIPGSKQS